MLQDLGNLGEILGGIGVVVTLAYLAVQIRRSTRAQNAATADAIVDKILRLDEAIVRDGEMARIMRDGSVDRRSLEQEDRFRFHLMTRNIFVSFYAVFQGRQAGAVEAGFWGFYCSVYRDLLKMPGLLEWWERNAKDFPPEFQTYVKTGLIEGRSC